MTVVKTSQGYKLKSKKTGRNLGTSKTKAGIKKREKQVQYFKNVEKYKKDHGRSPSWGPKK